jgi:hypothetical protein
MSDFLRLVQEATPSVESDTDNTLKDAGATPTKRGGILKKVVSGAQKISSAMDTIEKYGTGKWDINDVLQKMLSKQLDKSTDKVGAFGKGKYSRIKLGTDIIDKINNYTDGKDYDASKGVESSRQGLSAIQDTLDNLSKEGDSLAGESALNLSFLDMINEAAAVLDKDREDKFKTAAKMKGDKDDRSAKLKVWDVLKSALDLPEDASVTLVNPDPQLRGKKEVDRRVSWISKGVPAFLQNIKDEYPDIPFTFEGHNIKDGLSVSAIEQEEEEFNFNNTTRQDWIETLGAAKAEKIVRGLVDIYPGDRIVFEEPVEDEPEVTLTDENALFELAGRTSFGEKGIQWTLKPMLADAVTVLKQRNIKYLTFLLQTNDNAFRAPESNIGIIYAYDNSNQPINPITTESVKFQWNGQEELYTLSTDNSELMGIKYSEGQFPINKDEVLPLTDDVHVLYRPDEDSAYMKFKIVQDMHNSNKYLIDKDKGAIATDEDIAEAEAVSNK